MSEINSNNFQTFGDDITLYPGQRVVKIGDKMFPVGIGSNAMPPVLSHITATAEDIVAGKVSVDSKGNAVVGSVVLPPVEEITATAEDTMVGKVGMDNTGKLFTGTLDPSFYKCAAVYGPYEVETVVISGCPTAAVNGEYLPTANTTTDWEGKQYPVYVNSNGYYYYFEANNWMSWGVGTDYTGNLQYSGSVGGSWNDMDWMTVEGMTATNGTAMADADVPKTWDGYKAVQINGVYTFETSLTTDLTWSAIQPQKYGVYNGDASIKAGWLNDGTLSYDLVFHAPLTDDLSLAETGQPMNNRGVELAEFNGKKCAYFNTDRNRIMVDYCPIPAGRSPYTITMSAAPTVADAQRAIFYTHSNGTCLYMNDGKWWVNMSGLSNVQFPVTLNEWERLTLTRDAKGISRIYQGTTLITESKKNTGFFNPQYLCIGAYGEDGDMSFKGYIKDFRVYNRALTEEEIAALVDEFVV